MTVRKEPRRGAVILFASMFVAGNLYSSAGGAVRSAPCSGVERHQAAPSERDNDPRREIFSACCKKHAVRERLRAAMLAPNRFS
jgi:hypothetical protein